METLTHFRNALNIAVDTTSETRLLTGDGILRLIEHVSAKGNKDGATDALCLHLADLYRAQTVGTTDRHDNYADRRESLRAHPLTCEDVLSLFEYVVADPSAAADSLLVDLADLYRRLHREQMAFVFASR